MLLPHLRDRAVTRIRWPHGVEGSSSSRRTRRPARRRGCVRRGATTGSRTGKGDGTLRFPICDDLATLTWLANLAALELHVHQWTVTRTARPATPTGW